MKKPVEPAAIPGVDKLTLSATPTQNVPIPSKCCPVTARPGFSNNPTFIYPNGWYSVKFVVDTGSGNVDPASGPTDVKGEVKATITRTDPPTVIHTEVPMGPSKPPLKSNNFTCKEMMEK